MQGAHAVPQTNHCRSCGSGMTVAAYQALFICAQCEQVQKPSGLEAPHWPGVPWLHEAGYLRAHATALVDHCQLATSDRVLHFATNTSDLPKLLTKLLSFIPGVPRSTLNVDAVEPAHLAEAAEHLRERQGSASLIVIDTAVVERSPDLHTLFRAAHIAMRTDGFLTFDTPYLPMLLINNRVDMLSAPVINFFTSRSLYRLLEQCGFTLVDVQPIADNPLWRRWWARPAICSGALPGKSIITAFETEYGDGLTARPIWAAFEHRATRTREALAELLEENETRERKTLFVAGTSPYANALFSAVRPNETLTTLLYNADDLTTLQDTDVVLLDVDGADHFIEQHKEAMDRGVRFIVPLPNLEVYP